MKISENFDRWMFDYKEGNLSPAEMEEFENFLIQHPEFEVDAEAWDMAYVPSEPVAYPNAHKLEKKRRVAGWYYWGAAASLLVLLSITSIYWLGGGQDIAGADQITEPGSSAITQLNSNTESLSNNARGFLNTLNASESLVSNSGSDQAGQNSMNARNDWNQASSATNDLNVIAGSVASTNSDQNLTVSKYDNSFYSENWTSQEASKLEGGNHTAKYAANPEMKNLGFDVTKKSNARSGNNAMNTLRKAYRRIERMLGYPVGLTNLRDPELLMPQSSLLAFNSAFTGGMLKPRLDINYRNQWLGSSQNSQKLNISYDNYVYGLRGGVGILLNAQDYGYGQFGDYNVSLLYSPKLVVSKKVVIEPSVKLTLGTMVANGDKLQASTAFEMDRGRLLNTLPGNAMSGLTQQWYKDYGLGLMVNTKWFYAGASADNLSGHYENVYGNDLSSPSKSPIKLSGIIGTDYVSNTKTMTYSPFVAYQQYGSTPEFWAGMNYRVGWLTVGGAVSNHKEFTASAGLKFETFKLVYHYDYTQSTLMDTKTGSHNIGIRFNAKRKNQRLTH